MVSSDIIWVFYIRRVSQGKALQGAASSAFIVLLGAFVVVSYVKNWLYIIPTLLGAFVGTFIAIKIDTSKRPPSQIPLTL